MPARHLRIHSRMEEASRGPFDNIESAHEYVGLLCEALQDARDAIAQELAQPSTMTGKRHLDALRLADYKLRTLEGHFTASRRLLTDLRTLRRYLFDERASERQESLEGAGQNLGEFASR
jgi:hypothetical protein